MNDTRIQRVVQSLPGHGAAFLLGFLLMLLIRWAQRSWGTSLLTSSLIEEGMKVCLFLALAVITRSGRGRLPGVKEPELLPLICIIGFAVSENSMYFLYAPTTSIYQRLFYSYPIHLNTGLLYTIIYLSLQPQAGAGQRTVTRVLAVCFGASGGIAYHFFLNVLALAVSGAAVYMIGGTNLLALMLLFAGLHRIRIERSLIHAGL